MAPERPGSARQPGRRDWTIAAGTGVVLTVIALMGADWPPPPGFIAVAIGAAILSRLIAFALPRWRHREERHSIRRPAVEGALVCAVMWLAVVLLPFSGEPTVSPGIGDYLIGGLVAATVGALGAALLASIA